MPGRQGGRRISKKIFYLFPSLIMIVILSLQAEEKQEAKWKGKVETKSGVKTVSNPDQPVFGEVKFDLEEDLILGSEKDENDTFDKIWDIQVDAEGNIYVYDIRECKIRKISPEGKYIKDIGRRGQGPGEFQSPRKIWVDERTGNIYAVDYLKIIIFDKEGTYRNSIHLQGLSFEIYVDADGNLWSKGYKITDSGPFFTFDKISTQGEILKEIVSFPERQTTIVKGRGEEQVTVVQPEHGYEYKFFVSNIDDQSFLFGYSNDYELTVVDKNGEPLFKIRQEERGQPFSGKEKDKILSKFERMSKSDRDKIQIPKTRPFFNSIFSDSEGRIYVQRVQSPLDESKTYEYDIFSREGYYLYKTKFLHKPSLIKSNYFYAFFFDEDIGGEIVKRYRIKNWGQIKKGL